MNRPQMRRLVYRLLLIGMLVACLGVSSFNFAERKASAVACCSSCEPAFNSCIEACGDPPSSACIFFCNNRYNRCLSTCDPGC